MVYGGQISFCLYMVHELVHTSWNWAAKQFEIVLDEGATAAKWMVCGLLVAATLLSMLLFHAVEEPGRHWMRKMIGARPESAQVTPAEDPWRSNRWAPTSRTAGTIRTTWTTVS